jgi:hypothetical protein
MDKVLQQSVCKQICPLEVHLIINKYLTILEACESNVDTQVSALWMYSKTRLRYSRIRFPAQVVYIFWSRHNTHKLYVFFPILKVPA